MTPTPPPPRFDPQQERESRQALVRLLRVITLSLMAVVTLLTILQIGPSADGADEVTIARHWWIGVTVALTLFMLVLAIDILTPVKKISILGGIFFGLLAGIVVAVGIGFIIRLIAETYDWNSPLVGPLQMLVGICMCYLGVTVVLQTQDDFRLLIPYVEFSKQMRGLRPLLLDTSALIDGRVLDIANAGFFQSPIIVPQFVLAELQALSDSAERLKRAKGRRGLDLVSKIQNNPHLDITIDETDPPGQGVDTKLVELAASLGGAILTTDSGLTKMAGIQDVAALNIHTLANAMKTQAVAGETLAIEIVRKGEQPGQGVGFLLDGTMVVVEDGQNAIGQTVEATVSSSMQTNAGRLLFARIGNEPQNTPSTNTDEHTTPAAHKEPEASSQEPKANTQAKGTPRSTLRHDFRNPRRPPRNSR